MYSFIFPVTVCQSVPVLPGVFHVGSQRASRVSITKNNLGLTQVVSCEALIFRFVSIRKIVILTPTVSLFEKPITHRECHHDFTYWSSIRPHSFLKCNIKFLLCHNQTTTRKHNYNEQDEPSRCCRCYQVRQEPSCNGDTGYDLLSRRFTSTEDETRMDMRCLWREYG